MTSTATATAPDSANTRPWPVLAVILTGYFMILLDNSVLALALLVALAVILPARRRAGSRVAEPSAAVARPATGAPAVPVSSGTPT